MWQLTGDRWQVTGDMWHVTCDTWHMTGMGRWTFSQNFSSLTFTVWEWRFVEDRQSYDDVSTNHQWMNESMNQSISDGGDCRTAPATPGLLKILSPSMVPFMGSVKQDYQPPHVTNLKWSVIILSLVWRLLGGHIPHWSHQYPSLIEQGKLRSSVILKFKILEKGHSYG